jgi:oligopeptide transport system permease protein
MKRYLFSRLIQFPIILAVIYLLTFLMVWVVPGSPFENSERGADPAKLQQMKERFKADKWYTFLAYYPYQLVVHQDFGPSMKNQEFTVNQILAQRMPVSFKLGLVGLGIAVVVGMVVGTLSAVYRDGLVDWAGMTLTLVGISIPAFVMAALLLVVFIAQMQWFSIGELDTWDDYILPGLALSLAPMAYIVRLQRVSMLDVLGADYVRTARAKGLSKPKVVIRHCLRNAFLPVLSYLGPAAATTLTGSFVVERVFALDGLGQAVIDSVTNRDQTMILALVMVYSALVLFLNLIVDLLYGFVDPRIDVTK